MVYNWSTRIFVAMGLAAIVGLLSYANSFLEKSGHSNWIYLVSFLMIMLLWEFNNQARKYVERKTTLAIKNRLLYQAVLAYAVSFAIINLLYTSFKLYSIGHWERPGSTYSLSIFIMVNAALMLLFILVTGIHIGLTLMEKQKISEINAEKLKKESTQAKLESLKSQVNPHFLFNNLNILGALIEKDASIAKDFLDKFADVYRYVLISKNKELVSLREELAFMEAYLYLLEKRFQSSLQININCQNHLNQRLPPLALQLLIENAIKHNVVSVKKPLGIWIFAEQSYLIVKNTLQRKATSESPGIGLLNITNRYSFYTDVKIEVEINEAYFTVKLPLLQADTVEEKSKVDFIEEK